MVNVNATISGLDWVENQKIIYPFKDAFVFKNQSNKNYGNNENFIVGNLTDYNLANGTGVDFTETFFFFNLRQILTLESISSITFSFYGETKNSIRIAIETYIINALWDEQTITWNNKPTLGSFIDVIYVNNANQYEFNITHEAMGKNSISICLRAPSSTEYFQGFANESSDPNKARLSVNYLEETIISTEPDLDFLAILLIGALSLVVIIIIVSIVSGRIKTPTKTKKGPKRKKRVKPTPSGGESGLQSKMVSLQAEIEQLKEVQDDLILQARQAERDNMSNLASELYAKCKDIALNLFKYGVKGQSDLIKKFTTLEHKFAISHEFDVLNKTLGGLTGEQFSRRLQAIMDLIIQRKRTSSILQNLKRWIEDYQTKSTTLSEFDKRQIAKAIEFWKQF